jgi:predicted Zn finger-like uncharacterized protein
MLTRCPSCETGFRITSEQIRARQGRVRCGNCQTVFNALEALTEEGPVRTLPPPTPQPVVVEAAPEVLEIAIAVSPEPTFSIDPTTTAELPVDPLPEPRLADEPEFSTTTATDADVVPSPELPPEAQVVAATDIPGTVDAPDAPSTVATPPLEPLLHQPLTGTTPARRWPWAIGAVLMLLVLAIQAVIHFRTELVVLAPEARPALESLCSVTGCRVDLPRKVELITIEASDLHPEAEPNGALTLMATLRNRAPFAQMYPHLELTLTDTSNAALARRILLPDDYLPQGTVRDNGLPPGELAITLHIDSGNLGASGYRLYLFYP